MRLDLFLKASRLIPRRSLAQKFCDAGLITVNGVAAKSSKDLRSGDEIGINRPNRSTKVRVTHIPEKKNVAKSSAGGLYELIEETRVEDDFGLI